MRYFFNLFMDGELVLDEEGTNLSSDQAAQEEALACKTELDREFQADSRTSAILEVLDESGRRIMALPVFRCCN